MMTIIPPSYAVLSDWNILINLIDETEHFVGYDEYLCLGRMSTVIVRFDEESGQGSTQSGSTYQTVGLPGQIHPDALYVLERVLVDRSNHQWKYPEN